MKEINKIKEKQGDYIEGGYVGMYGLCGRVGFKIILWFL